MQYRLKQFIDDQSGSVTVDWVVLTAAVIGLGGAAMTSVGSGAASLGQCTGNSLAAISIGGGFLPDQPTGAYYAAQAVAEFPDRKIAAIKAVRAAIRSNAPSGYGFSNTVDTTTDLPIYISADGLTYKYGDQTISVADYAAAGSVPKSGGLKYLKTVVETEMANPGSVLLTNSTAEYDAAADCPDTSNILNRPLENMKAQELAKRAVAENPNSRIGAVKATRTFLAQAAPVGYQFSPTLVDVESGYPIYSSLDGLNYRIGSDVVNVVKYQASGKETAQAGLKYALGLVDAELEK